MLYVLPHKHTKNSFQLQDRKTRKTRKTVRISHRDGISIEHKLYIFFVRTLSRIYTVFSNKGFIASCVNKGFIAETAKYRALKLSTLLLTTVIGIGRFFVRGKYSFQLLVKKMLI